MPESPTEELERRTQPDSFESKESQPAENARLYLLHEASSICMAAATDAILLLLGLTAAIAMRGLLVITHRISPFQASASSELEYAIALCLFLGVLIYEEVYGDGLTKLDQTDRIIKALTGGFVITTLYTFAIHRQDISRLIILSWYVISLLIFSLLRPIVHSWLARWAAPALTLYADDSSALELIEHLDDTSTGIQVLNSNAASPVGIVGSPSAKTTMLVTRFQGTASWAGHLATKESDYGGIGIVLGAADFPVLGCKVVNFRGLQLYVIQHPLSRNINRIAKRTFDLAGSIGLLLAGWPLFLVVAILIKFFDNGPLFYGHRRLGRNGHFFKVWKFRTMAIDADRRLNDLLSSDPHLSEEFRRTFKLKNDPRVTRIGKFLRKTSLDELPQLWNVLKGEMSLVGPRPIVESEKELYGDAYPIVSTVQPGVTGIWQTSGRNEISYHCRKHFDVYYVRNWNLWLDLAIIVRTIQALILPDGY